MSTLTGQDEIYTDYITSLQVSLCCPLLSTLILIEFQDTLHKQGVDVKTNLKFPANTQDFSRVGEIFYSSDSYNIFYQYLTELRDKGAKIISKSGEYCDYLAKLNIFFSRRFL